MSRVQGRRAWAAIAARVLEDGSETSRARSLHRLLAAVDRQDPRRAPMLVPGGVLVVDEAGMVGTRQLASLISLTQAHQTRLALVGDPHQLPEIDAGGLFAALARQHPPRTCSETNVNAPAGNAPHSPTSATAMFPPRWMPTAGTGGSGSARTTSSRPPGWSRTTDSPANVTKPARCSWWRAPAPTPVG